MVRRPCSFGVGAGVENDVVTDLATLFNGILITAGLEVATDGFGCGMLAWLVDGEFLMSMCTLSVARTAGGGEAVGLTLYVFNDSTWMMTNLFLYSESRESYKSPWWVIIMQKDIHADSDNYKHKCLAPDRPKWNSTTVMLSIYFFKFSQKRKH